MVGQVGWLGIQAGAKFIKAAKHRKIQKAELKAENRELQAERKMAEKRHAEEDVSLGSELSRAGVAGSPAAAERVAKQKSRQSEENAAITRGLQRIKRRKKAGRLDITSIL